MNWTALTKTATAVVVVVVHADRIASSYKQHKKHHNVPHDATSSTRVAEIEKSNREVCWFFFCLVEFFSYQDQNH